MRKFLVLALGLTLVAAACNNKAANENNNGTTPQPIESLSPNPTTTPPSDNPLPASEVTITFTSEGYSPSNITIKQGTKVNFVNNSSKSFWPASAPHPSHTDYPQFDAKQAVAAGESWSFIFDKVGIWRFHDHLSPTKFGSITVTE